MTRHQRREWFLDLGVGFVLLLALFGAAWLAWWPL
jgi:hypothetical protein